MVGLKSQVLHNLLIITKRKRLLPNDFRSAISFFMKLINLDYLSYIFFPKKVKNNKMYLLLINK